jgi:peptidoglycan/LPS O-acetylase OafA/YrhL
VSSAAPTILRPGASEGSSTSASSKRSKRSDRAKPSDRSSSAAPDKRVTIPLLPGIDGLRGVAVAAVLLFHAGFSWAKGGFLGVSTFFTVSGFLITMLLVWEFSAEGRISLRRFWFRRYRRLMPASLLCLAGVVVFGWLVASPAQLDHLRGDVFAALAYVANWRFIVTGQSYARLFAAPSPVLHFWSLAIEEQFYLVFPVVVTGALVIGRGSRKVLAGVFVGAALVSLALMFVLYHPGDDPSRVYYGTGTRAFELLLGAILALALSHPAGFVLRIPKWAWATAGFVGAGVTVLLWTCARQPAPWLYQGGLAGYAAMSCLVIVATIRHGVIRTVLSWSALRWLGRISYGVYLFHWPIFLWLTPARTHLSIWPLFGLRVAVTLVVAVLSAKLLELPIRERRRPVRANPALLSAAAIVVVVLGTVVVTTTDPGKQISFEAASTPELPVPTTNDATTTAPASDVATPPTLAPRLALAPGEAPRVLLVGDSAMLTLGNGLERWSAENGSMRVWNAGKLGCSVGRGGLLQYVGEIRATYDYCDWSQTFVPEVASIQPHVVVALFGTWDVVDRQLPGDAQWRTLGDPVYDAYLRSEVASAMNTLTAGGARLVWLTHPYIQVGITEGLPGPFPEEDHGRMDRLNAIVRQMAASNPRVTVVDLEAHLQTLPEGDSDLADRPDGIHWNRNASYALAPWFGDTLLALARDEPPPSIDATR